MKRRDLLKQLILASPFLALNKSLIAANRFGYPAAPHVPVDGSFRPTWDSLSAYRVPDWFRDAKFGIWAHWGPQCEPESGDWYARNMYMEASRHYKIHLEKYGHPSKAGFKEVIHQWKAEQWDPGYLVGLYKKAGAKYFMALANHHDNFDLYKSRYQPQWNATRIGPRKDLVGGWSEAAKKNGLRFGVSVHAAHAWSWMETARRADKEGPLKGIPYDGIRSKADGKGTWWEGLDPQELYEQVHKLSLNSDDNAYIHKQWHWGEGVSVPSERYCEKFFNRTIDLIDSYDPDLVYFDDTALPLWPVSDAGLRIAAHFYNRSMKKKGRLEAVIFGKILDEQQRKCMVWDIERGQSNQLEPLPWQTDTCLGKWHYDRGIYESKSYKSAKTVMQILADVVSKNGNLLLSVPVRGNGSIDELELAVVNEIGEWMALNGSAIFGTRPWHTFGEGPAMESAAPLSRQGFNEGKGKPFTHEDIRFTTRGNTLYAIVMEWPATNEITIKSLKQGVGLPAGPVSEVALEASGTKLSWRRDEEGLKISLPGTKPGPSYAVAIRIS